MTLVIRLLGPVQLSRDDQPVQIRGYQPLALLAYLLLTGQAHTRQHLVDLCFDRSDDPRASLRWSLSQLRGAIGGGYLLADRQEVAFNFESDYWLDVAAFEAGQLELYRGDFLEGIHLREAFGFEDWLFFQRERFRGRYQSALEQQLALLERQGEAAAVVETAHRLLRLDNLQEEWYRALIQAYAGLGQREAALAQFELCRQVLQAELGLEPGPETVALVEAIQQGHFQPARATPDLSRHLLAGRFIIEEPAKNLLGQGGMGEVYRGNDSQTGEPVAIKLLKPELVASRPELLQRFQREGEALRRLNHPHIVKLLTAVEKEGQHYLVMEYVAGGSLRDLLQSQGRLPIQQVLEIGLDLADALTRAHRLNIIHRDLKPENILLAPDGTPRITDFGIARLNDSPALTQTGLVMGTLDYLSPEACQGESLDDRTDIWAFGVLLYELLIGQRPFSRESLAATLTAILTQPAPDLRQQRPEIPAELAHLVRQMLEKELPRRIPTVRLIGTELEAILKGRGAISHLASTPLPHHPSAQASAVSSSPNLPPQPTPFMGREKEVADLARYLKDPTCRLLTLVGPGGIGKTRLSIQVAAQMAHHFAQGVYFVPLQAVQSANFLVVAIADVLKMSLAGPEEPLAQVLHYLRDKQVLLVLDNFEQLLAEDGATLLGQILGSTPAVKLFVTSREVLNLQEERLYPIQGLPFPAPQSAPSVGEEGAAYAAIQLFNERARRVRPDFSLAEEGAAVIRICQLVEGIPLALELAASWVKTLRCEAIAAEIQRNLDFLVTPLRNVPDRQRSMRAIFDYSWRLLSEEERYVFKRLVVFRGGFRRRAAEAVASASLAILTALVDKSLLRWEPGGRYQIHELLRQYAEELLEQSPEEAAHLHHLHCAYYADFLQQRSEDIIGERQREVIREILAELENVRAAWGWAVQWAAIPNIQKATYTFYQFCDYQGRFQEGSDAVEKAAQRLSSVEPSQQRDLVLAGLLVFLGWSYIRVGRLEEAKTVCERSQTIYNDLDVAPPPGFSTNPLIALGVLSNALGDYTAAAQFGEEARRLNEVRADKHMLSEAFYVLGHAAFAQGQYEVAQRHAQQAYVLTKETNNRWFMAYILNDLGNVARALNDSAQARQHYQASYAIRQEFDDPEGMALALNHLGELAQFQQAYQEAEQLHRQSLAIYREINDQGGLATSLNGLGRAVCALGDYQAAQAYFQQALQITTKIQFVPLTLSILIGVSELLGQMGKSEGSIELLTLVLHHPASDHETKAKAQQSLRHYESTLPADLFASAVQRATSASLDAMVDTLIAHLSH